MKSIQRMMLKLAGAVLLLASANLAVAQPASPAAAKTQYIVVFNDKAGEEPDAAKLGGHVDFRKGIYAVVTMPDEAVEAWQKHGRVKYLQRVVLGTGPRGVMGTATAMATAVAS